MHINPVFELTRIVDGEEFQRLFTRVQKVLDPGDGDEYVDRSLSHKGLTVVYRKSQYKKKVRLVCIFRPSESEETVGVSPPSREKQVQVHGRESTGVLFWKEMAKERFAKRSSACHLFRLESFFFCAWSHPHR